MMVTDEFNNSTLNLGTEKNRVIHIFQNVFQEYYVFCRIFDLQYDMKNGKVRKGMVKGQTEVN